MSVATESSCVEREEEKRTHRTTVSFAGCGFMGMYHVGVGLCLQEHVSNYLREIKTVYGASAGSIVAVSAICGVSATEGYKFIRTLHDDAHTKPWLGRFGAFHPSFDLMGHVRRFLDRVLPSDAHRQCRRKVGVSLTVFPNMKNWIVSDFNTRAELIQAVVCSCYIPLAFGFKIPTFRGKQCCDGGLSCNIPHSSNPDVITVSPFSGECDICPNGETETFYHLYLFEQTIQASWSNLYRGFGAFLFFPWKEMDELCQQGFHDAFSFIKREGILTYLPCKLLMHSGETTPIDSTLETTPIDSTLSDDDDASSGYVSQTHSRQSSIVGSLDEILVEIDDRRDSLLFVEKECDGGLLKSCNQKPQFRWTLKPKSLFKNSSDVIMTSVTDKRKSLLDSVSEYQAEDMGHKMWNIFETIQTSSMTTSSSSLLPPPVTT